jgi:hypothetical protein
MSLFYIRDSRIANEFGGGADSRSLRSIFAIDRYSADFRRHINPHSNGMQGTNPFQTELSARRIMILSASAHATSGSTSHLAHRGIPSYTWLGARDSHSPLLAPPWGLSAH